MKELEAIYSKFHDIDKQLNKLEKATQKVIITGGKYHPQPKPININEQELINLYNYTPQILSIYATPVSINAQTYRQKEPEQIALEYTISGYYWVILLENQEGKHYYLVPNGNLKINFSRLKNYLELLFLLQGDFVDNGNEFVLRKLGKLEILPSGETWILKQKGEIFSKISPSDLLLKELEKFKDNEDKIPDNLDKLLTILNDYYTETLKVKARLYIESENIVELYDKSEFMTETLKNQDEKINNFNSKLTTKTNNQATQIKDQQTEISKMKSNLGYLNFVVIILLLCVGYLLLLILN